MSVGRIGVPVLMYHHIADTQSAHTVSIARFREQLTWLQSEGYRFLSGEEYEWHHANGVPLRQPGVLITFDDGWLDNWVHAIPVLNELKVPAVFFIVTSWPGEGSVRHALLEEGWQAPSHESAMERSTDPALRDDVVMRWSELCAARDNFGIDLQCHSHGHGDWWQTGANEADIEKAFLRDIRQSRESFEHHTGEPPTQYCWPKGQFTVPLTETVRGLGFNVQYSTLRGTNLYDRKRSRLVRRINVEDRSLDWFSSQIRQYSRPAIANSLARIHQYLHGRRLAQQYHSKIPAEHFLMPPWRLV